MPITKSAKKALKQSKKRRIENIRKTKTLRGLLKKVRALIAEKKTEEAKKIMPEVYKVLDKSSKAGLIKKNTASRNKSRLTKLVNKK